MINKNVLRESVCRTVVVSALMSFALGAVAGCANVEPGDPGEEVQIAETEQPLALRSTKLWVAGGTATRARIPICFLPNVSSSDRARIRAGANAWQDLAGIAGDARYGVEFFGWQSCPADPKGKFISIAMQPPGASPITHKVGRGGLDVSPSVGMSQLELARSVPHELGHVLGFQHEFARSDYTGPCAEPPLAGSVGITSPDSSSLMNYSHCGSSDSISLADMVGFTQLYGPTPVLYSPRLPATPSQVLAIHNGDGTSAGAFINPAGTFNGFARSTTFILAPTFPGLEGQPVYYGETVKVYTNGGIYLGTYLIEGGPTAHDVMVQDRVTMTKVSAPASTKMPKYIRFISMGIGRVF